MPSYPDHYLIQFGGALRGDIWSCNIRMLSNNALTASEQQDKADDIWPKVVTYIQGANSGWASQAQLTYVKFNRINPDGGYQDPGNTHVHFGPATGNTVSSVFSNQDALVVSWVTAKARGRASKGRIYIPCPNVAITAATGRIGSTLAVANAAATFLSSLNNDPNLANYNLKACVASSVGAGELQVITGVRVGDVMDTQRRRRNALVEVYSTATTAVVAG